MDPADETRGTFRGISIPRRGKLSFACYDHRPNKVIIAYITGFVKILSKWSVRLVSHLNRITTRFCDSLWKDGGSEEWLHTVSYPIRCFPGFCLCNIYGDIVNINHHLWEVFLFIESIFSVDSLWGAVRSKEPAFSQALIEHMWGLLSLKPLQVSTPDVMKTERHSSLFLGENMAESCYSLRILAWRTGFVKKHVCYLSFQTSTLACDLWVILCRTTRHRVSSDPKMVILEYPPLLNN